MDDLLTDHGDPEKRISDLEHQLAEQKRGADPAIPHDAATSRRFVASADPPSTRRGVEALVSRTVPICPVRAT